jgi:hypothetical protein
MNKKRIHYSNSYFFNGNKGKKPGFSYLLNTNSLRKVETSYKNKEINDYNKDNTNNISIYGYSQKKKRENNNLKINEKINNSDIKNDINNNINNNININININNNYAKKRIPVIKTFKNSPKHNNIDIKHYISYYKKKNQTSNIEINKFPSYTNNNNNNKNNNMSKIKNSSNNVNINYTGKGIIIPSSAKMVRKYVSHISCNNAKLNEDNGNENKEFKKDEGKNNVPVDKYNGNNMQNKRDIIKDTEKFNIYNINLNFFSKNKKHLNNNEYQNDLKNKKTIRKKTSNSKKNKKTKKVEIEGYHDLKEKNNLLPLMPS